MSEIEMMVVIGDNKIEAEYAARESKLRSFRRKTCTFCFADYDDKRESKPHLARSRDPDAKIGTQSQYRIGPHFSLHLRISYNSCLSYI